MGNFLNKPFEPLVLRIQQVDHGFLACDDIEQGMANKIPLWLFGFLY